MLAVQLMNYTIQVKIGIDNEFLFGCVFRLPD